MEKVLIVSDSHGDTGILINLDQKYSDHNTLLLHNGDSGLAKNDPLVFKFHFVAGNCDRPIFSEEETWTINTNDRLFQTHGHLYDVKSNFDQLLQRAETKKANLVTFGHTHQIFCEVRNGFLLVNPGSISYPRGKLLIKTYAIISFFEDKIEVQYYNREHEVLKNLHFVFPRDIINSFIY